MIAIMRCRCTVPFWRLTVSCIWCRMPSPFTAKLPPLWYGRSCLINCCLSFAVNIPRTGSLLCFIASVTAEAILPSVGTAIFLLPPSWRIFRQPQRKGKAAWFLPRLTALPVCVPYSRWGRGICGLPAMQAAVRPGRSRSLLPSGLWCRQPSRSLPQEASCSWYGGSLPAPSAASCSSYRSWNTPVFRWRMPTAARIWTFCTEPLFSWGRNCKAPWSRPITARSWPTNLKSSICRRKSIPIFCTTASITCTAWQKWRTPRAWRK